VLTQTLIKSSRTFVISVAPVEITKENQGTCRTFSCFLLSDCFRRGTKRSSGTHISGVELPAQVSVVETASLGAEAEKPIERASDHLHCERVRTRFPPLPNGFHRFLRPTHFIYLPMSRIESASQLPPTARVTRIPVKSRRHPPPSG